MRVQKALVAVVVAMMVAMTAPGCLNEGDNSPPRAIFQTTVSSVDVGDVVMFDATNSSDKDGRITSYHWDFGDGTETLGMTAVHVFDVHGIFNVTLTVTDDMGKKSIFVQTILVNGLPRAVIDAEPDVQYIGEAIAFSAERSHDVDGTIASFRWDFGDGNGSTMPSPSYVYGSVGSYLVTLSVTDNRGAEGQSTRFVKVSNRQFNVNFTVNGENLPNVRDWTDEGETTRTNVTIDDSNLFKVVFRLSWRDNMKPIGGPANDLFRLTVTPPAGFPLSANGTAENLTLYFPLTSIPLNRTWEGKDAEDVRAEVDEQLGTTLGTGSWLVHVEAVECGGFRDADDVWFDDPGNFWDLAIHYEYFVAHVTQA